MLQIKAYNADGQLLQQLDGTIRTWNLPEGFRWAGENTTALNVLPRAAWISFICSEEKK